jgi:hypothetical protein
MAFGSDQILWYNNGKWGELGYGVANVGDNKSSLNSGIRYLVDVMGRNLAGVMRSPDVNLRRPPTINTLTRIHKLIIRARTILSSRQKPAATPDMEAIHYTPAQQDFNLYPVPFFRVNNGWLKEYSGLILGAISEAAQHTDNAKDFDFGVEFAGTIGQYLQRVYKQMATELFGATLADAAKSDYMIPDTLLAAYDPTKYFTSTELIDTIPAPTEIPTEDDLKILTDGIPASLVLNAVPWPSGGAAAVAETLSPSTTASNGAAFAPAPGA